MRIKFTTIFIIIVAVCTELLAQPYYTQRPAYINANKIWPIGDRALNFNTSPPDIMRNLGISRSSNLCGLADPETGGRLLFYSGTGVRLGNLFNERNTIMPNGTEIVDLFGGAEEYGAYSNSVVVPVIGDEGRYYIFSAKESWALSTAIQNNAYNSFDQFAVFYSVVNMNLYGGLGDVEPGQKNVPLTPVGKHYTSAVLAIPGNCNDIWLVLQRPDSFVYESYHITEWGIDTMPVVSRTNFPLSPGQASFHNGFWGYEPLANGVLQISPNRHIIKNNSCGVWGYPIGYPGKNQSICNIARFDPNTGSVSDELKIGGPSLQYPNDTALGAIVAASAFSPDGSKLYTIEYVGVDDTSWAKYSRYGYIGHIYQYDYINTFNADSIDKSKLLLGRVTMGVPQMRLYNDTIYLTATRFDTLPYNDYLGAIVQPNAAGTACRFVSNYLTGLSWGRFPNETVFAEPKMLVSASVWDTTICSGWLYGITLSASDTNSEYEYEWSDGSTGKRNKIYAAGTYWVRYGNACNSYIDSFEIKKEVLAKPVINVNVLTLGTTLPYHTYQWVLDGQIIAGANERSYQVIQNGRYQVIVGNDIGCVDTSEVYEVSNATDVNQQFTATSISMYPNPARQTIFISSPAALHILITSIDGKELMNIKNSNTINLQGLNSGVYMVLFYDTGGRYMKTEKLVKIN